MKSIAVLRCNSTEQSKVEKKIVAYLDIQTKGKKKKKKNRFKIEKFRPPALMTRRCSLVIVRLRANDVCVATLKRDEEASEINRRKYFETRTTQRKRE